MQEKITRREFIKSSTAMAISASMFLVGCGGGGSSSSNTNPSPITPSPVVTPNPNKDKKRVLVYFLLGGGNDSFNMLVPTNTSSYNEYKTSRSNLAIDKADLLALNGFVDSNNKTFGLHPSMSKVQELFNNKKLSFISNIGPLNEVTTKANYLANKASIPLGLMSHADQIKHWQTSIPNKRTNIGWFGRLSDEFQANKNPLDISMNMSLSGTNILQNGENSKEYSLTKDGSVGLSVKQTVSNPAIKQLNDALLEGFDNILNKNYSDSFEKTYMQTTQHAQTHHEKFDAATKNINISHSFTNYDSRTDIKFTALDKDIGSQFKMIAKAIKAADTLGMKKQTFFVHYYGWDHHDELLNNHKRMLEVASNALGDFQASLEELDVAKDVITFVGSDFGRSLSSNGNGTDHAWGGNVLVMGDEVEGGKVFGTYPSLQLGSSIDIGGGVLIPSLSTDEMFAELSLWYGVDKSKLSDYFPNLAKFYDVNANSKPIGFTS